MRRWSALLSLAVSIVVGVATPARAQSSVPLSTAGPYIDEFSKKLVDTSLPEVERLQIVGLLALWQNDQARDPLVVVLDDKSDALRTAAARALGWKGNVGAIPALTKRLAEGRERGRSLIVKADRGTRFDLLMEVMNAGLSQGFSIVLASSAERR